MRRECVSSSRIGAMHAKQIATKMHGACDTTDYLCACSLDLSLRYTHNAQQHQETPPCAEQRGRTQAHTTHAQAGSRCVAFKTRTHAGRQGRDGASRPSDVESAHREIIKPLPVRVSTTVSTVVVFLAQNRQLVQWTVCLVVCRIFNSSFGT